MPIYEFYCKKCNCQFENLVLSSNDPAPSCPSCCNPDVEKIISAGSFRPNGIPSGRGGFSPPKCSSSGG